MVKQEYYLVIGIAVFFHLFSNLFFCELSPTIVKRLLF